MKAFQSFDQTLGSVWATLKAVATAIEKDRKDYKAKTATVKVASLVRDSLARVEGMLGGIAAERLSSQADALLKEKQKPQGNAREAARDSNAVKRSWSSVVREGVAAQSEPRAKPVSFSPVQWSSSRTVFVRPVDESAAKRQISRFEFGESLASCLQNPEDASTPAVQRLVRTSTGDWKVQLSAGTLRLLTPDQELSVGVFGKWRVESPRIPVSASLVLTRVPEQISDENVARGLYEGAKCEIAPELWRRLEGIRCQRLLFRPKGQEGGANMAPQRSRSVRVFLPNDLRDHFLKRGHMMLHFSVHSVRPYVPPSFFCKHCKQVGSHSTKFHRFLDSDRTVPASGGSPAT